MTTDDIASRFTACEAVSFCQFIRCSLSSEELDRELPGKATDVLFPGGSSARSGSATSGSTCSEAGLDNTTNTPQESSPLQELVADEKHCGLWESLPGHFVAKWSIGGPGWVQVVIGFLFPFVN